MIRVVLVDDHELVRVGFRAILTRQPDIEVVGEAQDAEQALPMVRKLKPDVVLMDIHLPGMSGLEATARIVDGGGTRVLAVTAQEERPFPRKLLEAGASGYVTKACKEEELLRAVRDVARGGRYLSHDGANALALDAISTNGATPFDALSPREFEVAVALARGESMRDIAGRLHLSAKTVATHKYRLLEKLGIEGDVALAHLAPRHGLLRQPVSH